jgi:hypothetical protein
MFEFISKKFADIKILHEGYTADYFLIGMKTNALFPILFIQNNLFKKKSGTDIFYPIIAHVHFREILSGYFLFSRFDWSIFATQLVARHMKEIIIREKKFKVKLLFYLYLNCHLVQHKKKSKSNYSFIPFCCGKEPLSSCRSSRQKLCKGQRCSDKLLVAPACWDMPHKRTQEQK